MSGQQKIRCALAGVGGVAFGAVIPPADPISAAIAIALFAVLQTMLLQILIPEAE